MQSHQLCHIEIHAKERPFACRCGSHHVLSVGRTLEFTTT